MCSAKVGGQQFSLRRARKISNIQKKNFSAKCFCIQNKFHMASAQRLGDTQGAQRIVFGDTYSAESGRIKLIEMSEDILAQALQYGYAQKQSLFSKQS
jgi:hypothetical protein